MEIDMALIEVKNLEKTYDIGESAETLALTGASFKIEKGEFLAIIGPSGSGKSTLMHVLGLLDRPTGGTYIFDSDDINKLSDEELAVLRNKKMGFVFQAFNLLPRTSVLENVKLPLNYSKEKIDKDKRAKEVLESVNLGDRINFHTNQISGGQKQRVAIARALVNNPSVIFADEPTGNLDSKSGAQIMDILRNLNKSGNTIILVTHDKEIAENANRIISVKDGMIVSDKKV